MLLLVSAAIPPTFTCELPGDQGAVITGTQGIGVSTPMAADVAEATVGLAIDWHIPNVAILATVKSVVTAINMFIHFGLVGTMTANVHGAIPKLHWSTAP